MPRYASQPNENTCGPTAVINAGKWAGLGLSVKHDFDFIMEVCETIEDLGTWPRGIDRGLRVALGLNGVKVTRKRNASIKDIEEHLSNEGSAVVCNKHHVFLITDQTKKMFITQNYREGSTTGRVRKNTIQRTMIPHEVWFLKG